MKMEKSKKTKENIDSDTEMKLDDAILLLDRYNQDGQNLYMSLKAAGFTCPTVVIEDDGFLPDDVMSVYSYFLGDFKAVLGDAARPKYFNEIRVPDYWEISGTNASGKVQDLDKERGRIFYAEPKHKRIVRVVDWYDERGFVRSSDHYNRYGAIYGRTVFNAKGQKVNKSYFSAGGQEVIVENFVTGDIILNEEGSFTTRQSLCCISLCVWDLNRAGFSLILCPRHFLCRIGLSLKKKGMFYFGRNRSGRTFREICNLSLRGRLAVLPRLWRKRRNPMTS